MSLLPVADARRMILDGISPLAAETVPLVNAHLRVSAAALVSKRTQPPFSASAMDGYAVRHADLSLKGEPLKVVGEVPAGHSFDGKLGTGEVVRIFTGAPVPDGADTILIQEDAKSVGPNQIEPVEIPKAGAFVRPAGLDFSEGQELLPAHKQLYAADLALLASMNYPDVNVVRKPRIGVLATGDELVMPGESIGPDQIVASNNFGIAARIAELGGTPVRLGIANDTEDALRDALLRAKSTKCDAIVTLGGASVGTHDLVQKTFQGEGLDLAFWKIAMRPGKPLMFGRVSDMVFLGLPGNPVSSMVCAELFLAPLINTWLGLPSELHFIRAKLAKALKENDRREDYLRATLTTATDGDHLPHVIAADMQDSSMLAVFTQANALIKRAPFAPEAALGDVVEVMVLTS